MTKCFIHVLILNTKALLRQKPTKDLKIILITADFDHTCFEL